MNQIKISVFLFFVFLFGFVSCKDKDEYTINSAFTLILQHFEDEAATRGKTFNLKQTGLIVEFADLDENTAGLCHYEDPIRIEIDKSYWNEISSSAGADLMKENLLFHELGHGLLGRKHLNTTLENGDWKSMMCGGDKVDDGRPWNINYRGMRRTYYLDELFNESTPAPDFSSNLFGADVSGFTPSVYLSFNSESGQDVGFKLEENSSYKSTIDNSRLRFQSKLDKALLLYISTSINVQSDFTFEITFEYPAGDATDQYGLIFGTVPTDPTDNSESIEYFSINNNRKMFMGNRTWYSFYTQLSKPEILAGGKNTLKVVKIKQLLYYFINNVYGYCSEIEATESGTNFGFMTPPNGTIWLDNFTISTKNAAGASAKIQQVQAVEFKSKTIENYNQRTIKNK